MTYFTKKFHGTASYANLRPVTQLPQIEFNSGSSTFLCLRVYLAQKIPSSSLSAFLLIGRFSCASFLHLWLLLDRSMSNSGSSSLLTLIQHSMTLGWAHRHNFRDELRLSTGWVICWRQSIQAKVIEPFKMQPCSRSFWVFCCNNIWVTDAAASSRVWRILFFLAAKNSELNF